METHKYRITETSHNGARLETVTVTGDSVPELVTELLSVSETRFSAAVHPDAMIAALLKEGLYEYGYSQYEMVRMS